MFSACSIPNTDISLDKNSGSKLGQPIIFKLYLFFSGLKPRRLLPLTFGHSLLLMLECKTAQASKIKTEKLLKCHGCCIQVCNTHNGECD